MRGPDVSGRRLVSSALVGRSEELNRLVSTALQPPAVAFLEGEAGIGKTRLVAELGTRLGSTGTAVGSTGTGTSSRLLAIGGAGRSGSRSRSAR
ncbi:MAG: ATP-binding protein [Micromonosporaceae bacterium]|nr:ATP-binding protein [Micromonosporaceae bacterium]